LGISSLRLRACALRNALCAARRFAYGQCGAVAEWSKALAWKVSIRQKRIEGSNPSRSATQSTDWKRRSQQGREMPQFAGFAGLNGSGRDFSRRENAKLAGAFSARASGSTLSRIALHAAGSECLIRRIGSTSRPGFSLQLAQSSNLLRTPSRNPGQNRATTIS
jgi:hypothetical protein